MENIIIYGAGAQGRAARRILESQGLTPAAFADRDETKIARGEWEGVKVIGIDALLAMDAATPVIIGIGASRMDTLREVDNMLIGFGFVNVFWSAVEYIKKRIPNGQLKPSFYGFEFSTNVGCTVACKWCAQELFVSRYAERLACQAPELPKDWQLSFETFKKICDKIPTDKNMSVDFSGYAEPYLNPQTTDMILYTAGRGHKIQLFTTLQGMTPNDIKRLKAVRFEHIVPHLADKDGNAKIPVTDDYLKLLVEFWEAFGYAIGYTNDLLVKGVSYHGELHPKVADALKKAGIDIHQYSNFSEKNWTIASHVQTNDIQVYEADFPIQCGQISYTNTKYINSDDKKFFDEKLHMHGICFPNGDVVACSRDYGMELVLGNMLQTDYYDLFDGNPEYERILAAQRDPNADVLCRKCEFAFDRRQMELVTRATHLKGPGL
jgi:hypothetical protein